jgi:hypothetical protein
MSTKNSERRSHILLSTGVSCTWAAIPFSIRELSTEAAGSASVILLVASLATYLIVRRLC